MIFRKFGAVALLALFLFSCGDDAEGIEVDRTNNDYAPNTVGSTWTYLFPDLEATVTYSIPNKAKEFDGKIYYATKAVGLPFWEDDAVLAYSRKEGDSYFTRVEFNEIENDEFLYLKDAPLSTKWTQVFNPDTDIENILELEIVEVNGSYTVNEHEFTNVIVVKVTNVTDPEDVDPSFTLNYYAKGVGIIKAEDFNEAIIQEMVSYSIN